MDPAEAMKFTKDVADGIRLVALSEAQIAVVDEALSDFHDASTLHVRRHIASAPLLPGLLDTVASGLYEWRRWSAGSGGTNWKDWDEVPDSTKAILTGQAVYILNKLTGNAE